KQEINRVTFCMNKLNHHDAETGDLLPPPYCKSCAERFLSVHGERRCFRYLTKVQPTGRCYLSSQVFFHLSRFPDLRASSSSEDSNCALTSSSIVLIQLILLG
ncbi:hypothetical protein GOODEAATRI_028248, partial [Goodea atripinnis]